MGRIKIELNYDYVCTKKKDKSSSSIRSGPTTDHIGYKITFNKNEKFDEEATRIGIPADSQNELKMFRSKLASLKFVGHAVLAKNSYIDKLPSFNKRT